MVTYYLDFEGGNDANTGLSFAQRWKTFASGATAARTAPGDIIRVMASPDPTSIGNATWAGANGRPVSVLIASSTNATPIVVTTSGVHGLVAGDYVTISGHSGNTNANGVWKVGTVGSTTTFQILQMDGTNTTGNGTGTFSGSAQKATNCIVKLASPLTQNIALCGGLGQKPTWTASTNVTCTQNISAYKEGYTSSQTAIAAAFTTGKASYYTLPSSLNLSSYQQVSFWVQQTAGTIGAAGAVYLALCTDTTGNTVAHTCNIPLFASLNTWIPVTIDFGSNLSTGIQSVALYVVTDNGAQTFLIDNIIACKASSSADSISLQSLIGKNTVGEPEFYPIQSINYDAVMLANINSMTPVDTTLRGYYGTNETVTTYKRETIKQPPTTGTSNTVQEGGSAGSLITYSGGWNRTDMSTQTGQTWFDLQAGTGTGLAGAATSTLSYVRVDLINFVRCATGYQAGVNTTNSEVGTIFCTACTSSVNFVGSNMTVGSAYGYNSANGVLVNNVGAASVTFMKSNNNTTSGGTVSGFSCRYTTVIASNNASSGALINQGSRNSISTLTAEYNAGSGILISSGFGNTVGGGSTTGNTSGISFTTVNSGQIYLSNFVINEATEVTTIGYASAAYSNRHDNTDNNSWIFYQNGTVNQQTSVVDSPATTSWKMSPTNSNANAVNPIMLKIGTVVCAANSAVTVTARMQRDNAGLTMRLICPGGQISGVANDVSSDMTAAANTWETVSISFTPTKAGGVDIYAYAFGGTTFNGYVCNLTASQV